MPTRKKKAAKRKAPKRKTAKARSAPKKVAKARAASRKKTVPRARKAAPKRRAAAKPKTAPKARAARRAKAAPKPKAAKPAIRRRDGTGHLDPAYAKDLRALSRDSVPPEAEPFVSRSHTRDDLAENLAEEAIATATSGEDDRENVANQDVPEEQGGPFVVTTAGQEFADGTDESNPKTATREPFPRT